MTYAQTMEYINHFGHTGAPVTDLSRMETLLEALGNPHRQLKFVHIAGTNGKGSTAAMTASILSKAGYRTGLYTSPYIYRFHERIQVDGVEISDEDLTEITEYVKPLADSMAQSPTEFELVCCIAFEYFYRKKCDIVVLEVGMGGAWDATNVIEVPEVAVITNIGLDHTEILGDTVEAIDSLPQKERTMIVLYYMEGYDVRESAKLMGTTKGAVCAGLARAREKLRAYMEEDAR